MSCWNDLSSLRNAVTVIWELKSRGTTYWHIRREWCEAIEQCDLACSNLFRTIGLPASICICEETLGEYLPRFEEMHPEDPSVRALLMELHEDPVGISTRHDECEERPDYPTPGTNNFLSGVWQLVEAEGKRDEPQVWSSLCSDVILQVIMAWLVSTWGMEFPELWKQCYFDSPHDTDLQSDASVSRSEHDPSADMAVYHNSIIVEHEKWERVCELFEHRLCLVAT